MTANLPRPFLRRFLIIGLLTTFAATSAQAQQGQIARSDGGSDAIARFVMNFGRFIDWPDAAFSGADSGLSGERGDRIAIRMNRALIEQTGLNVREQLMRAIQ